MMRLLINGGGTAGHVLPAIAVAEAVKRREPSTSVLAIGGSCPTDRELFESAGYSFQPTKAAALTGAGFTLPSNALRMGLGVITAFKRVAEFRPQVAISTGAYASVPGATACILQGIPQILIVVDASPGHAARVIGRFAAHIAVTTQEALSKFPQATAQVTGLPLRAEFQSPDSARALRRLEMDTDLPIILIAGGSQGARIINEVVGSILGSLLELGSIVHLTGSRDIATYRALRQELPSPIRTRYHPISFLKQGLADLMVAADLAITRAGGTTHELAATGLPSILIPGLFAHGHQEANAHHLASAGAAVTISEIDLDGKKLLNTVIKMLADKQELKKMSLAAASLGTLSAADSIAETVRHMTNPQAA